MEREIIASIVASRKAFDQLDGHFDPKKTLSPIGQFWYEVVREYYKRDMVVASADISLLRTMAESRLGSQKSRDTLLGLLDGLSDVEALSPANVVGSILDIRRNALCNELAGALASNKKKEADKLFRELADIWDKQTLGKEEPIYAKSVDQLFDVIAGDKRILLLPRALAERTSGGALPGHHVGVFGRTEIGKSTFVINLVAGFIYDERKTLYIGNEDNIDLLKLRAVGRVLKRTAAELAGDPAGARKAFIAKGGEQYLRMIHMQPGDIGQMKKEIEEYEPEALIMDQIRNMEGSDDGLTAKMETNAKHFRNMLATYALLGVSVTQAGDRSSGHRADSPIWLGTGDVDSSRVGYPGTLDLQLGIGGSADMINRGQRAISICKNKLQSGSKSREGFICNFDLNTGVVS